MAQINLIIFIGLQASGKSTFYRSYFSNYFLISKDLIKNNKEKKQRQLLVQALQGEKSIVVDNTNPSKKDRQSIIEIGKQFGAKIIGYYFQTDFQECCRRNSLRANPVPLVGLKATAKKLETPFLDEGFDEIVLVSANKKCYCTER